MFRGHHSPAGRSGPCTPMERKMADGVQHWEVQHPEYHKRFQEHLSASLYIA